MTNRKAFSLMEIMVSVMIISVVGLALLQINSNSYSLYITIFDRTSDNQIATVGFVNFDEKIDKKEQNIYEAIKDKYDIDNDSIMKNLKEHKVYTSQTLVNSITLSDDSEDSEEIDYYSENEESQKAKAFTIDIYSISSKVDDSSNRDIYSVVTSGEL